MMLDGRPVVTIALDVHDTTADRVTWTMVTPEGQTGDIHLGITPGVEPGDGNKVVASGCS